MINYKETLQDAQAKNIKIDVLLVAYQVASYFDPSSKDFDIICDIIDGVYCRTYHLCIETICQALKYAIDKKISTSTKLLKKKTWTILENLRVLLIKKGEQKQWKQRQKTKEIY